MLQENGKGRNLSRLRTKDKENGPRTGKTNAFRFNLVRIIEFTLATRDTFRDLKRKNEKTEEMQIPPSAASLSRMTLGVRGSEISIICERNVIRFALSIPESAAYRTFVDDPMRPVTVKRALISRSGRIFDRDLNRDKIVGMLSCEERRASLDRNVL